MTTTVALRPVQWTLDRPDRCACAGSYRPQVNAKGKLIKSREPAWKMKESTRSNDCLQALARGMAAFYQLGYQHCGDSRKSDRGYPDVHLWPRVGATGRGSTYVELKRMGRDPEVDQVRVMSELAAAGHPVYLVRPCCLLTGVFDQIMADVAGVPPKGVYASLDQAATAAPAPASVLPATAELAARAPAVPAPRRARLVPELPGIDPPDHIPGAVGYIVPMSAAANDYEAVVELEAWLRAAGFPPVNVPFPIRVVAGDDVLVVQVRAGTDRVWRAASAPAPFPEHLAGRLGADVVAGPFVTELIERAVPFCELPDEPS